MFQWFRNTDLDLQRKKHGIHKLIVTGLIAHTCVEATVRYAAELGYEVALGRAPELTHLCFPKMTQAACS